MGIPEQLYEYEFRAAQRKEEQPDAAGVEVSPEHQRTLETYRSLARTGLESTVANREGVEETIEMIDGFYARSLAKGRTPYPID